MKRIIRKKMQKFWFKKVDADEKVLKNRSFWHLRRAPLNDVKFKYKGLSIENTIAEFWFNSYELS